MEPGAKPLLVFDGDCNFCRRWIARWRKRTGDKVEYAPYQAVGERFAEIPAEDFRRSVVLIEPDGTVIRGARAVLDALAHGGSGRVAGWCYRNLPGCAPVAEALYRFVAGNRILFSLITRLLWGARVEPPTYSLTRRLFLQGVALVYLIAFVSLWVQIDGLIGSQGILPVERYMEYVEAQVGSQGYWLAPTLAWLDTSDRFLHVLCGGGTLLAILLLVGVAPRYCLAGLWVGYLSLTVAGQTFLSFQWDTLLLETGFLALLFAPGTLLPGRKRERPPTLAFLWLLRWLLFKLLFASGLVKLWSNDETWWDLTALEYHYWTTPLPTWTGWFVHQLPAALHRSSVAFMFVLELVVPFLIFLPRRLRLASFFPLLGLQVLILATGNYGFFNLNTIVLCVLVLDDEFLHRFLPARWRQAAAVQPVKRRPIRLWLGRALATLLFLMSLSILTTRFRGPEPLPDFVLAAHAKVRPFRSINNYGLFANMTTTRREIVFEGSNDGTTWEAYEFHWKPGDVGRRPAFVQPHMPRLDWQMWFAALGNYRRNPWLLGCMQQMLQGSPPVLAFFEENPFPEEPPRFLRAVIYDYAFTDPATRAETGAWWKREFLGLYAPVLRRPEGSGENADPGATSLN